MSELERIARAGVPFAAPETDFHDADDIFYKQIRLEKDQLVPQHAHDYDHTTLLAAGAVRMWCDGELIGDIEAPRAMLILAGKKHAFLALKDGTLLYCIHNLRGKPGYKHSEEHQLWA